MSYLEDAKVLFGDMRNLTKEEQEALYNLLDRISEPTGITLFDVEPRIDGEVKELNIMEAIKMPIGTRFNFDVEFLANYIEVIKSMDNKKILCWDGHKFQKVPVSTFTCEMKLTPIQ